ncbi:MAG: hypothetical protein ACM3VZ_06015 [Acidobacteriota bacterium]
MDSLRRTLVLGLPAAAVAGLHGCGGAEDDPSTGSANPQSVDSAKAQAESAPGGSGISIRDRSGSNFPFLGRTFDIQSQPSLVQAVINPHSAFSDGPVLALQLSTTRTADNQTLVGNISLSVKLGPAIPTAGSVYNLGSGGALTSDALITCRQISPDSSVKSYAFRIVSGTLVVSQFNLAAGQIVISLRDVVANAAVGFSNLAQGSIAVLSNSPTTIRTLIEDSGTQLA